MADDKKPSSPSIQASIKSSDATRQRRELIRRRAEVQSEMESLRNEVSQKESVGPTEELQSILNQEIERQVQLKKQIVEDRKALVELRNQKNKVAKRRNSYEQQIREKQTDRRYQRRILRSEDSSDEDRQRARAKIELIDDEIDVHRTADAEAASKASRLQSSITKRVGNVEYAQGDISRSRKITRAVTGELEDRSGSSNKLRKLSQKDQLLSRDLSDYDKRQRELGLDEASRYNPQMLLTESRRNQPRDVDFESHKAAHQLRRQGGTSQEAQQMAQATAQFNSLFESIKSTKKALAELTAGTEEHARKQEELTKLEASASDAVAKMD